MTCTSTHEQRAGCVPLCGGHRAQLPRRNVKRFRRVLVSKAHRLVCHSTPGWRVTKKKRRSPRAQGKQALCFTVRQFQKILAALRGSERQFHNLCPHAERQEARGTRARPTSPVRPISAHGLHAVSPSQFQNRASQKCAAVPRRARV